MCMGGHGTLIGHLPALLVLGWWAGQVERQAWRPLGAGPQGRVGEGRGRSSHLKPQAGL